MVEEAYGAGDLLVEMGSSLGLWLGISVIGLFDLAAALFVLTGRIFKDFALARRNVYYVWDKKRRPDRRPN